MKRNATARIILYSLLILILTGILVIGIGVDLYGFLPGFSEAAGRVEGGDISEAISLDAAEISSLEIEWAAGSITILTADTDQITFFESGNLTEKYSMVYSLKSGELKIEYAKSSVTFGFGSIPSKDLTITVPRDWVCRELELDAAAVNVTVDGLTVQELKLDGASAELTFNGSVDRMDIDGASVELDIRCTNRPSQIEIDGASCEMRLYLPEECGFLVQMDGLSCSFRSDLEYTKGNGDYMYGDRHCKVAVDGMSCSVSINHVPAITEVE